MEPKGPLVVSFYRGVWRPYCNLELQALQAASPEIEARGASVIAISPQTAPNSRKSQRDNKLMFPILSDDKSRVAAAFGLRFSLPDYLVELYKGFKNDLPAFNDNPAWVLPMPARFVIATDGIIAYAEINPRLHAAPRPVGAPPGARQAAHDRSSLINGRRRSTVRGRCYSGTRMIESFAVPVDPSGLGRARSHDLLGLVCDHALRRSNHAHPFGKPDGDPYDSLLFSSHTQPRKGGPLSRRSGAAL